MDLTVAKAVCLLILALTAAACGASVDSDDLPKDDDDGRDNQLVVLVDGAYGVQLATNQAVCRRLVDGQLLEVSFLQKGGDDDGLRLDLQVAGDLDAGDALTADNATRDRFFDFRLTTPRGASFHYASAAARDDGDAQPASAALTVLKATDFQTAVRVWLEGLPQLGGPANADGTKPTASVRGTFECARWTK